jgi:hypothetical protein
MDRSIALGIAVAAVLGMIVMGMLATMMAMLGWWAAMF